MKSANTNVFVRPPRILFLIESEEHYRTAVKLCSSLWGGFFCEIMLKDKFAGVKNPDVCYDFVVDLSKAEEDKDSPNWKLGLDDIVKSDWNSEGLDFVDARAVYIELADREVEIIAPENMGAPEQTLLSLMRFGCPGEFNKRNYLNDLKTKFKIVSVATDGAMGTEASKGQGTPIQITTIGLEQKERMLRDHPGTVVLIGDGNSLDDLTCAWNFRARHSRVLFVDRATSDKHFDELKNLIAKESEEAKKSDDENKKFSRGWAFLSSDPSDAKKFEEQLKSVECHVLRPLDRWRYIDSKRPFSFFARSEEEYLTVTVDGRNIQYPFKVPEFIAQSAKRRKVGLSFELPSFIGFENEHLKSIPPVEWRERCYLGPGPKEMSRIHGNVITEFTKTFGSHHSVWANDPWEFWRLFFWPKNIDLRVSSPGYNLRAIIQAQGGVDPGCRVLKLGAVRELFKRLQDDGQLLKSKIEEDILPSVPVENRELGLHWINRTNFLAELCDRGFLRQGFVLRCERCRNKSWYAVSDLGDNWKCRFCRSEARTPMLTDSCLGFKSDGLFQISGGVQGAIAPLLALWRLNHFRSMDGMNFLPSFELYDREKKQSILECDALAMMGSKHEGQSEIILIEGKVGRRIKDKDLQKLKNLEKLIGVECYKCISSLGDGFEPAELKTIQKFYDHDPKWILLTKAELEPYEIWDCFPEWKNRHIMGIEELSMATIQKYLKPKELKELRDRFW